jgi:predicted nucleic acid-binding protein
MDAIHPHRKQWGILSCFREAVSFTDCLVMAVADEYGTKDIFDFDKQFADAGYIRLDPL